MPDQEPIVIDEPTTARRLMRDLDEGEFEGRYACDRFTAAVLANRYRYVAKHMSTALLTQAFSPIIRDWYDFAASVSGPQQLDYPLAAVSDSIPLFLGTMADAVRITIEEYGADRVAPGDVIICNDPYRIGGHVNDTLFIRPVFFEGEIIAFMSIKAHMLDMGGVVPGGFSGTKRDVYETGLVIPPVQLYADDAPVRSTFSFLLDNVRMGAIQLPDIQTIFQSLRLAERLMLETAGRYGSAAVLGGLQYCVDASADTMYEALCRVPDGDYEGEDSLDADGASDDEEYVVRVKVRKRGGHVEIDLSGTSRQARTSINGGFLDAKTTVGVALRYLIDRGGAYTSGSYRHLDVVIPPGTIASAMPPDGPIFLYWESTIPVLTAIFGALQDALGVDAVGGDYGGLALHNANGVFPDGTPWVSMAQAGGEKGPWGATKHGDADSYCVHYVSNNIDPPTEQIEADIPVVILRREYAPDTAGPGENRGGAAVVKDSLWLTDAEHRSMPLHLRRPSGVGVHGGGDGRIGGVWMFPPDRFHVREAQALVGLEPSVYALAEPVAGVMDPETNALDPAEGEYVYFADPPSRHAPAYTMFRYINNGGGGWGDPLARDPARVARDVRDGYVTIGGALEQFGVVVTGDPDRDPEGVAVDAEATAAARERRRR